MKKYTTRFTLLTLMCVPFLMAGTAVVNAENTQPTSEPTTEISTSNDETLGTTETSSQDEQDISEINKANPLAVETKTLTGTHGKIKLAKIGSVEPKGDFTVFKNDYIKVEKDGTWTALKEGETRFKLDYTLSEETLDAVHEENPDYVLTKPSKTEEISAKFSKSNIQLEIIGGPLKSTKGQLTVQTKEGVKITGAFTPINSATFTLDAKGNYTIPNAQAEVNQPVTFKLDATSIEALSKIEANKGKIIETDYNLTVTKEKDTTKKTQKDIHVTFKNQGIITQVGSKGRLLLNDTIEGVKLDEQELKDVRFKPLTNNPYLTIDELGNWQAKAAGDGPLAPAVILSDSVMKKLEAKFPDNELNIVSDNIDVKITQAGGGSGNGNGGSNDKTYAPVQKLPQTGEQKMKFAGVIGLVIIVFAGILFYFKKKNKENDTNTEDNTEE